MEREFMIDKISNIDGKSGTIIKYACVTCDHEEPEVKMTVSFESSVPTAYKKAMGSRRLDTFTADITSLSHQATIE